MAVEILVNLVLPPIAMVVKLANVFNQLERQFVQCMAVEIDVLLDMLRTAMDVVPADVPNKFISGLRNNKY